MEGNGALYSARDVLADSRVAVSLTSHSELASMPLCGNWVPNGLVGFLARFFQKFVAPVQHAIPAHKQETT